MSVPPRGLCKSFCDELVKCLKNKDMDKYADIREIARKSCPEFFSDKEKSDSAILQMFIKINNNNSNILT